MSEMNSPDKPYAQRNEGAAGAAGAGRAEYRGSVRDVATGAFRNFREWSDLAAFMIERVEENERGQSEQPEPTK